MTTFINLSKYFLFACVLMHTVIANDKVVIYWGQESAQKELPLRNYCATGTYDIIVIGFAYMFPFAQSPASNYPALNFASHCETAPDPSNPLLLICPAIGADITYCQGLGVQILMSFGGGVGLYGFDSDAQAVTFATTVWDMFLGGTGPIRPFGNAILDGIDLDIEGGATTGYISFINTLRQYFASSGRTYYISSAPQCVYPDGRLGPGAGTALQSAWFDYVWVQFYNNYCGVNVFPTSTFNFNLWASWARSTSLNPNVKVFIGAPASPNAAGSGYVPASTLQTIHNSMMSTYGDVYGGMMLWDCSNSDLNNNFAGQVANFVHSGASPSPVVTPPVVSSPVVSSPVVSPPVVSPPVVSSPVAPSPIVPSPVVSSGKKTTGVTVPQGKTSASASGSSSSTCTIGNMKCLTSETYSSCSHGLWGAAQSCQTGLNCEPSGNFIYCV